jgi:hypothetical protein
MKKKSHENIGQDRQQSDRDSEHGIGIQVEAFWVVTLCSAVVVYQRFGGPSSG